MKKGDQAMTDVIADCMLRGCQMGELHAEIERLTNAIRRIDGINDYPANYSPTINAVCDEILRPHLAAEEPKP